jgi:hypothetical protein
MTIFDKLRVQDLQKFNHNASRLLLEGDRLEEFFRAIGYQVEPHGDGYRGVCPACRDSFCFVGVNGRQHPVFWKCFAPDCASNAGKSKYFRNLVGLVRGASEDDSMKNAIAVIATFLGCAGRSFDITNGKAMAPRAARPDDRGEFADLVALPFRRPGRPR